MLSIVVDDAAGQITGETNLYWTTAAKKVVNSRAKMQKEIDKIDFGQASDTLFKLYHVDEARFFFNVKWGNGDRLP